MLLSEVNCPAEEGEVDIIISGDGDGTGCECPVSVESTPDDVHQQENQIKSSFQIPFTTKSNMCSSSSASSSSSFSSSSSSSNPSASSSTQSISQFPPSLASSVSISLSNSFQNVINRLKKAKSHSNQQPPTSTTALILENRPPHLPAKAVDEAVKHRLEYESMVKEAKRKEAKDAKMCRKLHNLKQKEEERMTELIRIWTKNVLTDWEVVKSEKWVMDLWWTGIPPSVRGKVWKLAIGNDLNLTKELFHICVNRSKLTTYNGCSTGGGGNSRRRREGSTGSSSTGSGSSTGSSENIMDDHWDSDSVLDSIKLDVSRTFPQLGLFNESGPYHETLTTLLSAYVYYRPDINYVQGMCFIAGMLLLNMESVDAFICLSNLLNDHLLLSFFRVDQRAMNAYYSTFEVFFKENLPHLFHHFNSQQLTPDFYLMDWIYSLFSKSLPLDVSTHVWDLILRDGDEFVLRVSLGILSMYQDILLNMDFINIAQYLTKLPDDIDSKDLFNAIGQIRMTICGSSSGERFGFKQVLSAFLNGKQWQI